MATLTDTNIYQSGWIGNKIANEEGSGRAKSILDWKNNDTLKIALLTSNYTPDASSSGDTSFSDISADEVSGSATGYSSGGEVIPISTIGIQKSSNGAGLIIDDTDVVIDWTGATFDFQYAVIYDSGGTENYLVGYMDFGSQSADNQTIEITIVDGDIWTYTF